MIGGWVIGPAIGIGQAADVDREEINARIDVDPGGDAPDIVSDAAIADRNRLLGDFDGVEQWLADFFASGNCGVGDWDNSI